MARKPNHNILHNAGISMKNKNLIGAKVRFIFENSKYFHKKIIKYASAALCIPSKRRDAKPQSINFLATLRLRVFILSTF